MKKSIVMISRSPEKFTAKQDASTFKMLFLGSILGGHRRKAQRFGEPNRMQSSQTARCHLFVLNESPHNAEKCLFTSDIQHQDLH